MRKSFIFLVLLFISSNVFPMITLQFDPSEPPRYEINGVIRVVDDIKIDIYYRKSFIYSYVNTIVFKNGSFNPNSISIDTPNLNDTFFYAVYHLNNNYVDISGYTSKIPQNELTTLENLGRVVGLDLSSSKDKLMFPITKPQGNFVNLHLAMHSFYVLSQYLSQPPINSLVGSKPIGVVPTIEIKKDEKTGLLEEKNCHYSYETKQIFVDPDIYISYYDSTYKHEYGHYLIHQIFNIPFTRYTDEYEIFEPCDEQTALNEGFTYFLESRGTFNNLRDDFPDYINLQNKITKGGHTVYTGSLLYNLYS